MDNYVISEEEEVLDAEPPFPESMKADVKVMELHKNTKFGNIIDFVNKLFEDDTIRRVIFRGVGDAADKCVSCVEVYKRKRQEELYQWTALSTAKRVTYWDPLVEGMNRCVTISWIGVVNRDPLVTAVRTTDYNTTFLRHFLGFSMLDVLNDLKERSSVKIDA
ncbi:hypothetical protein TELCIR_08960 [Teladorsagia circumcincta]|uniref:DNA/RNA-binding protein Alba-like domain-containing protein n=1 Tax=Teladorsagia circumcincta TaxID=45464 RepID=A0A2G9UG57_TELCI|nr:hypothetical protein TELCIR_08960 [Teladorsagia circumcincta]